MKNKFQNIDTALPAMASEIMHEGQEVGSRLGERTMELLHQQIVLEKPWMREVLVNDRNANIVAQIAETMWVLAGRNDVAWLGHYLPRAEQFSDDGATWRGGYGPRLRAWEDLSTSQDASIDQIKHLVDLLSKDRLSRRAVVSIYDPAVDTHPGKDIPCNDFLSFISRNGRLDLSVFVRSNDLIWGWSGINAFEWSALQEIVAELLGLTVGHLIFNTTSLHVYDRHWPKADRLARNPLVVALEDSPRFRPATRELAYVDGLIRRWFDAEHLLRTGAPGAREAVDTFPEPMMKSWLHVIAWYWTGDEEYLRHLDGTRLWAAVQGVPKSIKEHALGQKIKAGVHEGMVRVGVISEPTILETLAQPFINAVDLLHREKSAAYGDSWKRRGEQMSILANIARKVDRLDSGAETSDETQADTAVDLLVYLLKYRLWLSETNADLSLPFLNAGDENDNVRAGLTWAHRMAPYTEAEANHSGVSVIRSRFEHLEQEVTEDPHRASDDRRAQIVASLISVTFAVAYTRWKVANGNG